MSDSPAPAIISVGSHPDKRVKSKYLWLQRGTTVKAIARFTDHESADEFLEILMHNLPLHHDVDDDPSTDHADYREALQRSFDGA